MIRSQALLETAIGGPDTQGAVRDDHKPFEPGEQVARYSILRRIGAGGMGVVYAAYDPDLDRKVAIKVLRAFIGDGDSGSDGRGLLLREAQAMAKLSHANVVAVHDVGVTHGRMFLAMEFVPGQTLASWLGATTHTVEEILAVFTKAGQGLWAAHRVDLIHRDFKPENVLICESGAVKVTDFGLARWGRPSTHESDIDAGSPSQAFSTGASRASGATAGMGTPAYMAPEQHMALDVDARADQFGFCVALWEGLCGQRPFKGTSRSELLLNMMEGSVAEPSAARPIPPWCKPILLRGLSVDPSRRYATMGELLAELDRDPSQSRRRGFLAALLAISLAGLVVAATLLNAPPPSICANMRRHLDGVWDEETHSQVASSLRHAGVGFSESTWERVAQDLDSYGQDWVAMRTSTCEATYVNAAQSEELLDLRMACLDERLLALRSLVDVLRDADATVVQNAIVAVESLPSLDRCADAVALREAFPRSTHPAVAAQIEALTAQLEHARALDRAGRFAEGLKLTQEVSDAVASVEYPPLVSRATLELGMLTARNGDEAGAESILRQAFFGAVRFDLDDTASQAASALVNLVGARLARPSEGRAWFDHALAYAQADGSARLRADALFHLGAVDLGDGKFDDATARTKEALEIYQHVLGERSERVLASLNQLGLIASDLGHFEQARAHFRSGMSVGAQVLGADHPDLARFINNLAKIDWLQGDFAAAKKAFEEALALQEGAFGPEHRNVAQLHNNLAAVAASTNDLDEAQRRFELALAIWEKLLGPEHPQVADALNNLAVVASSRGDDEAAREFDERALAIRVRTMEPDHPGLAQAFHNLGEDLRRLGRLEEAKHLAEKGLAIWEAKLDANHDSIAVGLSTLAHIELDLKQADRALPLLARAKKIRDSAEVPPGDRGYTDYLLGRALFEVSGPLREPQRGVQLVVQAAGLLEQDEGSGRTLAELKAWLDGKD